MLRKINIECVCKSAPFRGKIVLHKSLGNTSLDNTCIIHSIIPMTSDFTFRCKTHASPTQIERSWGCKQKREAAQRLYKSGRQMSDARACNQRFSKVNLLNHMTSRTHVIQRIQLLAVKKRRISWIYHLQQCIMSYTYTNRKKIHLSCFWNIIYWFVQCLKLKCLYLFHIFIKWYAPP